MKRTGIGCNFKMNKLQSQNDKLRKEISAINDISSKYKNDEKKALKFASMLVAPGESDVCMAPSIFPVKGCSRHFTRTVTLSATADNQPFGIQVNPDLVNFYSAQAGAATISGTSINIGCSKALGDTKTLVQIKIDNIERVTRYQEPQATDADFTRISFSTTLSGTPSRAHIFNKGSTATTVTIRVWTTIGFADTNYVCPANTLTDIKAAFNLGDPCRGFGFKPYVGQHFDVEYYHSGAAPSITVDSVQKPLLVDQWMDRGQVNKYRVSAMSVLASYRGNLLEQAGVIAALRAPTNWTYSAPNLYEAITKVPDDQYHGPLMKGAYTWWLPQDLEDLDFRSSIEPENEATSLYVGGVFGDSQGSLEITIDVVVDFYSPLQIFERKVFPVMSDPYRQMIHELSLLPAATCNPSHLEVLKKAGKIAANTAVKGLNFAANNPQVIKNFVSALSLLM